MYQFSMAILADKEIHYLIKLTRAINNSWHM